MMWCSQHKVLLECFLLTSRWFNKIHFGHLIFVELDLFSTPKSDSCCYFFLVTFQTVHSAQMPPEHSLPHLENDVEIGDVGLPPHLRSSFRPPQTQGHRRKWWRIMVIITPNIASRVSFFRTINRVHLLCWNERFPFSVLSSKAKTGSNIIDFVTSHLPTPLPRDVLSYILRGVPSWEKKKRRKLSIYPSLQTKINAVFRGTVIISLRKKKKNTPQPACSMMQQTPFFPARGGCISICYVGEVRIPFTKKLFTNRWQEIP